MKVLATWHSGVEKSYFRFFQELSRSGMDVKVCLPEEWTEGGRRIRYVPENGNSFETIALKTLLTDHVRSFFYPNLFKMIRVLKSFRPDILHIMEEPFSLAAAEWLLALKLAGLKSKTLLYSAENIDVLQRFPFSLVQKFNLKTADAIAYVPVESRSIWQGRGFKGLMKQIYLGIDTDFFVPQRKKENSRFVIGYIGRIVPEKGIDTLVDAAVILKNKSRFPFMIQLVGSGPYREEAEKKIAASGLTGVIEFKGGVASRELLDLYSTFDVFILPSRTTSIWKEQFGRVIPEAMACGVPVIGSDSGEIPRVIGKTGLVFREDSPEDLADKITLMAESPDQRNRWVREGIEKAAGEYSWRAIAGQYADFYREMLTDKEVL